MWYAGVVLPFMRWLKLPELTKYSTRYWVKLCMAAQRLSAGCPGMLVISGTSVGGECSFNPCRGSVGVSEGMTLSKASKYLHGLYELLHSTKSSRHMCICKVRTRIHRCDSNDLESQS